MKIKFNPFIKEARGKIGNAVIRLCHTGEWQFVKRPDMSRVKWSAAQKAHRERFRDAVEYAKDCMEIPELRAYYLEMARKQGTKRPFDEAVRDYFKGHDLTCSKFLRDIRKKQQNGAAPTAAEQPTGDPVQESSPQQENVAAKEQNTPERAALTSRPSTVAAPSTGQAAVETGWTFTSLVTSSSGNGESDFYYVSTMCTVNAASLPVELRV